MFYLLDPKAIQKALLHLTAIHVLLEGMITRLLILLSEINTPSYLNTSHDMKNYPTPHMRKVCKILAAWFKKIKLL